MMEIDYDTFLTWAKEHFHDEPREMNGKIRLNSIFCNDRKRHLYCKPSIGYFKCMKSGNKGSLYQLVMEVEKCSYDQAIDILGGEQNLRYFAAKVKRFFQTGIINNIQLEQKPSLQMPSGSFLITSLSPTHHYRVRAEEYLAERKLHPKGLWICVGGEYVNRIIIPYYDRNGDLVYYNARDLNPNSHLRYRGPDGELGAKKEEVVWLEFFPKKGTKIYLTEGEFDAMTLNECDLHGAAFGGKDVNVKQLEMLAGYQLVLSFDADRAGKDGLTKLGQIMQSYGLQEVSYIRPPKQYKDWNEMLQRENAELIQLYIHKREKRFDSWTALSLNVFS